MKKLLFCVLVVAVLVIPTSAFAAEDVYIHSWSPDTYSTK